MLTTPDPSSDRGVVYIAFFSFRIIPGPHKGMGEG
jgi:hypothetical protein